MNGKYDNNQFIIASRAYFHHIDESGFGEVMTLFNDGSTILEEVSIDYEIMQLLFTGGTLCVLPNVTT